MSTRDVGPKPVVPSKTIKVVELGTGWFAEKAGGLERVFFGLFSYFGQVRVEAVGLVVGSAAVQKLSGGQVEGFAPPDAPLIVRWARLRRSLRKRLERHEPDLIAAHFALYTFPVLDIIRNYPLVVHFHGSWALESEAEAAPRLKVWLVKRLEQYVYQRATRFIVLSQAFKGVLQDTYQIPEGRIDVVPGGIDTAAYDTKMSMEEARVAVAWPPDRPILLTVRRLVRRQGLENLIDAVVELRKQHPDVLLYIAGQGALRPELERRVQALGLEENVRLLGFIPDDRLALTYRAATFSVVPTVAHEGFGLITVESLAAGTPVLVTPIGGLPEVVGGLSAGLILPGSGVPDLVSGIGAVLSGAHVLPPSKACQRYVEEHFDNSVMARRTRSVYEKALREGGRR